MLYIYNRFINRLFCAQSIVGVQLQRVKWLLQHDYCRAERHFWQGIFFIPLFYQIEIVFLEEEWADDQDEHPNPPQLVFQRAGAASVVHFNSQNQLFSEIIIASLPTRPKSPAIIPLNPFLLVHSKIPFREAKLEKKTFQKCQIS